MRFKKSERQKIIDGYLQTTGKNLFNAGEFIDWLEGQPEHKCYDWFFGQDDATAARQHRIDLARRMASGLRIVVSHQDPDSKVVSVTTHEYPAYISPVAGRRSGGGYERTDPEDPAHMAELRRQGASSLRAWLDRYRGAFADVSDLSAVEEIVAVVDAENLAASA